MFYRIWCQFARQTAASLIMSIELPFHAPVFDWRITGLLRTTNHLRFTCPSMPISPNGRAFAFDPVSSIQMPSCRILAICGSLDLCPIAPLVIFHIACYGRICSPELTNTTCEKPLFPLRFISRGSRGLATFSQSFDNVTMSVCWLVSRLSTSPPTCLCPSRLQVFPWIVTSSRTTWSPLARYPIILFY